MEHSRYELMCGDCLDLMKTIADESIDAIIADLPYGTTYCKWDAIIPLDNMWDAFDRIIKPNGAIVLTASQPFTSSLVMSRPNMFRTEWIWDKVNGTNFANAKKHPLKVHESILVFGKQATNYYPIMVQGKPNHKQGKSTSNKSETRLINTRSKDDLSGLKYPKSIQTFAKHSSQCGLHPTQKPIELMEYLVKTYSKQGDTVLDLTMGSGTTGVACITNDREFIGIELDKKYFNIAKNRLDECANNPFVF